MNCAQTLAVTSHRVITNDLNEHETVYGGKLLEMLDGTASISASRFCKTQTVTAAVDQFKFIAPFKLNDSFCIESFVSGSGKRSLEVFAKIIGEHLTTGQRFLGATAFLTFVVLKKEIKLPPLVPQTPEEISVCQAYSVRQALRKQQLQQAKSFNQQLELQPRWLN
ncbi:acyl-CoA thioesterase [Liquorilactobacillus satsumensis]|uniref:acyl-CoA thioesterase n=1 Tax=Liquorilactobacillus satsumensis TaxID=259059 RepID=UPI001E4BF2F8|nr:acyl-CoA thioesterase [Liquorilactobacillus satsumensis]MCC7666484.1 acyl-CoA thioesterase [Liquorilactobacillus satsumensis]MCP9312576.1 acyl-CoA thioesterase [Liquorilactobacillus satsumensis]MCP9328883.1 acyl-CoA thioesterase [Liquorilactobacillus satsumensis]MCP9356771.1 acyl-CoA thioesterase [Liquorilactobacillus satsumensis]MCP9360333.1 acyl-CoA thioesterase [Liquorilactobacillus satsumensis]